MKKGEQDDPADKLKLIEIVEKLLQKDAEKEARVLRKIHFLLF